MAASAAVRMLVRPLALQRAIRLGVTRAPIVQRAQLSMWAARNSDLTAVAAVSAAVRRLYSQGAGSAGERLLRCVETEVGLEQRVKEDIPPVAGFSTSVEGCRATLQRQHGQELIKVQLDTSHALEVMPDELEEEEEEEEEPLFVPAFTVSVTNSEGEVLQFECSFDEQGLYTKQTSDTDSISEWDNMRIDSVSVVPRDCSDPDTVYTVEAENLSKEMYDHLLEYLQERHINEQFAPDIIKFYRVFEHSCYLDQCLKPLKQFLQK